MTFIASRAAAPRAGREPAAPDDTATPPSGRRGRFHRRAATLPLWMLIPCGIALIVVIVLPVLMTVGISFLGVDAAALRNIARAPFVGLENFAVALSSQNALGVGALKSLGLSTAFAVVTTVISTPIGFFAALAVNRNMRGRSVVRAIYLVPYVIPMFVTALLARIVFLDGYGLVDRVLGIFGDSGGHHWLLGNHAFWAMAFTDIWAQWPFVYLFILAGLQSIPREQFEAAELDGASGGQKIRSIILPHVSHMLKLSVLLSTLRHFGNFTLAYVMFSAPPPVSVMVLPISTFFYAFTTFEYGVAAALAVLTMVVLLIPGYIYLRASRITDNN